MRKLKMFSETSYDDLLSEIPELIDLDRTPQDPYHHAEGSAGIHTRMVLEELTKLPHFQNLDHSEQNTLWWAALFHDIGKIWTTRLDETGRYTSPYHSRVGATRAFNILWDAGICWQNRMKIYGLVKNHMKPNFWVDRPNLLKSTILLAEEVNLRNLLTLSWADSRGRITIPASLEYETKLGVCEIAFEESGCMNSPYQFANSNSRVEYAAIADRYHEYAAQEPQGSRVHVMWGLPGAGKDTWISENLPDVPVVSLDDIRKELKVDPSDNQGIIIQTAMERAKRFLRTGENFVWNATNINQDSRNRILTLAHAYSAHTTIVVVDTPPAIAYSRNQQRQRQVPKKVFDEMTRKLSPPMPYDSHDIKVVEYSIETRR